MGEQHRLRVNSPGDQRCCDIKLYVSKNDRNFFKNGKVTAIQMWVLRQCDLSDNISFKICYKNLDVAYIPENTVVLSIWVKEPYI